MVACVVERRALVADAAIETRDRIPGRPYRRAERRRDGTPEGGRGDVGAALGGLAVAGGAPVAARRAADDLEAAVEAATTWAAFGRPVRGAERLAQRAEADPIDALPEGYARLRRYAPRFIASFASRASGARAPL